jgi:hypothetical protein
MHSELPPGHLAVPHRKSCGCKVTNHGIGRHYLAIAAHNRGGLRKEVPTAMDLVSASLWRKVSLVVVQTARGEFLMGPCDVGR